MIRTCTRLVRFCIGVSRVDLPAKELRGSGRVDFHPVVGRQQQRLGACILNQPANQNLLTEDMIDQLYRFFLSYDFDHTVQNIWLESKQGVFSHGLDYKTLAEDTHYLDKLSRLAILLASTNKPVFAQVGGGAKGAGAHLLSMLAMPLAYRNNCFLKFDDVSRGLTPLLGGSHRLARLPLHLGLYLALTGDELNFEEMTQLGYVRGAIPGGVAGSQIRERLEEANLYFRENARYWDNDEGKLEEEERVEVLRNQEVFSEQMKYRQGDILSQSARNLNLKFAVNQELAASADYFNLTNPHNSFNQAQLTTINNYYQARLQRPLDYLVKHNLVQPFNITSPHLPRLDLARIDTIFGLESLEAVVSALAEEEAEWAQRALHRITTSDPLAAHLTFQLIKSAEQLPWIACLEQEFTVARRLLEKSSLSLKTYNNSSQYVLENDYSSQDLNAVPASLIEQLLSPGEGEYRLQHSVPAYSLHPYSDYYRLLPDAVRKYLNREQLNDGTLSELKPEVMRYLNKSKINYSSQVFDLDRLRKAQFQQLELERQRNAQASRLALLARDHRFLSRYSGQRVAQLDALSDQQLDTLIHQQLTSTFRSQLEGRFVDFQNRTGSVAGVERKAELFKGIKQALLTNLLHNGAAYEDYQRRNSSFEGPLYFDKQGRDLYSSTNPHIAADPLLAQLAGDLSQGKTPSAEFEAQGEVELPLYSATPPVPLREHEKKQEQMWELIRFRYDEKPQVWAEAYVYKEMVEQAARTSEELAGYLQWTSENFYDLLNQEGPKKDTYSQFGRQVVDEIRNVRRERMNGLVEVQRQRKALGDRGIYSKVYGQRDEEKPRQCFPYLFNDASIPTEFKPAFLAVLDSTLRELTEMGEGRAGRLLLREELGAVDRWINRDIAGRYTEQLRDDVEYVSSYLQMLAVKEMVGLLRELRDDKVPLEEALQLVSYEFGVELKAESEQEVHGRLFAFLHFLMDMHAAAKRRIRSPQAKLIDFINRLRQSQEQNVLSAMPFSFQSLLLMIAKDRRRIYDRFLGEQFVSEPEFYLEHIARESKKGGQHLMRRRQGEEQVAKVTLGGFVDKHSDLYRHKRASLIQNYFYYMMLFEKHVHQACGPDAFLPNNFCSPATASLNATAAALLRAQPQQWLSDQLKAVIEHMLGERMEAERRLTRGQLALLDQRLQTRFSANSVRQLLREKLEEEVFLLKNMFSERRHYDPQLTEEEVGDEEYTRTKRAVRNPEALKKLNNLALSEEIYVEYMDRTAEKEGELPPAESRFAKDQRQYYKHGLVTRLPEKSYHRMARDLFAYPEEAYPQRTAQQIASFKKTHLSFDKSVTERIVLSEFTEEYKSLNAQRKDTVLQQMAQKIAAVESL